MAIKTILCAPIYESQVEAIEPDHSMTNFAMHLASLCGAHLNLCIGVGRISLPSPVIGGEIRGILKQANDDRLQEAKAFGEEVIRRARSDGASASLDVLQGDYQSIAAQLTGRARTSDISLVQPANQLFALRQMVLEEMLFNTGRPVILMPEKWTGKPEIERIVLAWDGSAKAARAIGDAIPFIERAKEIELVTIEGDRGQRKQLAGADMAPLISRHAQQLHLTNLNCTDGDVSRVLIDHVSMTRADMLVMGAYGHTRLRQFVLGGVTRAIISHPPVPVLMSF